MPEFESVFRRLRMILQPHASTLSVSADTPTRYCIDAAVGPATIQAWGGKAKRPTIPVAWVEIGKGYVSYHLMSVGAGASGMSQALKDRMQGKTCFNFTTLDESLFSELEAVTAHGLATFRESGFVT